MPRLEDLSPALGRSALSGRWIKSSGGSLKVSWASSSVSFLFSGTKLSFYAGPGTERRDEANGGTPMIAIMVGPTREATLKSSLYRRTVDPEAKSEGLILDETTHRRRHSSRSCWLTGRLCSNWAHWSTTMWVVSTSGPTLKANDNRKE